METELSAEEIASALRVTPDEAVRKFRDPRVTTWFAEIWGERLFQYKAHLSSNHPGSDARIVLGDERTSGNKQVKVRISQSSGEICVDVEDNGPGVADEIAERLFEPFTTSKPRGMGLGLLLSRQIVETYGGKLWWERTSAKGTRFAFCLPCDRKRVDDVRDDAG